MARYNHSVKRKEAELRYTGTPRAVQRNWAYRASVKAHVKDARYDKSPKGRERRRKYIDGRRSKED